MAPPRSWVTNLALWDRVITVVPPDHHIENVVGWWTAEDFVDFGTTPTLNDRVGVCDLTTSSGMGLVSDPDFDMAVMSQTTGATAYLQNATQSPYSGLSTFGLTLVGEAEDPGGFFADFRAGGATALYCAFFGTPNGYRLRDSAGAGATVEGAAGNNAPHVWYFEFNGASSKLYVDGSLYASGALPGTAATAALTIGNTFAIGGGMGWFFFAEAKASTGAQIAGNVLAEANALIAKWGI